MFTLAFMIVRRGWRLRGTKATLCSRVEAQQGTGDDDGVAEVLLSLCGANQTLDLRFTGGDRTSKGCFSDSGEVWKYSVTSKLLDFPRFFVADG